MKTFSFHNAPRAGTLPSMTAVARFFNDGLAALNRQDLRNAESHFRRVVDLDRSNVPALNLLVVVLMSMNWT